MCLFGEMVRKIEIQGYYILFFKQFKEYSYELGKVGGIFFFKWIREYQIY